MARRRMISQKLIYDEEFNLLSPNAQNIFLRMLAVSDDFGVIPANEYTLGTLINCPLRLRPIILKYLDEILDKKLGVLFQFQEKQYFMFKRSSFDEINSYLIKNRTKSEFLGIDKDIMNDISKFQEYPGIIFELSETSKLTYNKIKDKRLKIKDYNDEFLNFWNLYPRKTGKTKAFESWLKINPPEQLLFIIMQSLEKHIEVWKDMDSQYIPHASTWLNQKRWEDEIEIKKTKSKFEWGNDD